MKKEKNQVSLYNLVFTQNWEDPESDGKALNISSGETLLAITSGGCNVLGFLLFDPGMIYSLDINPAQNFLLELKIASIRKFTFEEFISFSGLKNHDNRLELFKQIRPLLSKEAREFWTKNQKVISNGFIMQGKYERFIRLAGRFINFLQGPGRVSGLLKEKTPDEQKIYFDKVWNTRRFHYLFKLMFNKRMLAKRGLVADYFHFDDGSRSFAESFYKRSRNAFRNIPIKGNYFLSLYLKGKYANDLEVPAYLKKENFEIIKSRVDRIKITTADAQSWIDAMPEGSIDCFALSNICELMSISDTNRLFNGVLRTAKDGARIIFRNLMIPREVPDELFPRIQKNDELSKQIFAHDRSFVYGKVAAYRINKSAS